MDGLCVFAVSPPLLFITRFQKSEVSLSDVLKLTISLQVRTRLFLLLQYAKPGTPGKRVKNTTQGKSKLSISKLYISNSICIKEL